jgi:hypothetical protein
MALSADDLSEIDKVLSAPDVDPQVFGVLRQRFPHITWTRCDASDVTDTPFRTYTGFDIHLLDSAGHCAHVTADPAHATGIILAKRNVR